jgi:hypothetical protein
MLPAFGMRWVRQSSRCHTVLRGPVAALGGEGVQAGWIMIDFSLGGGGHCNRADQLYEIK